MNTIETLVIFLNMLNLGCVLLNWLFFDRIISYIQEKNFQMRSQLILIKLRILC